MTIELNQKKQTVEKKTKIVCTIGPACWEPDTMKKIIKAGMNVARVNAAFADLKMLKMIEERVRNISNEIALMLDIKGCNVRLNKFKSPINLKRGDFIEIGSTENDPIYPANYKQLYKDLKKGDRILFDDGSVECEVVEIRNKKIKCKIKYGKSLKPGKSINIPGVKLSLTSVTDIDKEQIKYAVKNNWDFVAASYIRDADDIKMVKKYIGKSPIKVIAKIEEELGVKNIDKILEVADGIMVARGDMGVELPYQLLPYIQKEIIKKCNALGKPVITATQVMDSMQNNPKPTRAEISDAANAVLDGTDAIMTSGETSVGLYPVETVKAIAMISHENEKHIPPKLYQKLPNKEDQVISSICNAAFEVVMTAEINKLVVLTETGRTARFISRHNLPIPIITLTSKISTKRQLQLSKGIDAEVFVPTAQRRDPATNQVINYCLEKGYISKTDKILMIGRVEKSISEYPHLFEYVDINKWLKKE